MGRCKIQATAAMTRAIESESNTFAPTGNRGSGARAERNCIRDTKVDNKWTRFKNNSIVFEVMAVAAKYISVLTYQMQQSGCTCYTKKYQNPAHKTEAPCG